MVLEQFLENVHVKRHAYFVIFLSMIYVFIAYGVAYLFFKESMSLVAVFTLTIILIPSLHHIISLEEQIERKNGLRHFFRNHATIFKVYSSAFLGILIGFGVIGAVFDSADIYAYQIDFLTRQSSIGASAISKFASNSYVPSFTDVLGLFSQNISVMLIAFVLSVFYGAGAVFLIVFNASMFSAFLFSFMTATSKTIASVSFIHFIPEISGFLLAAISGAILSAAILNESFSSPYFRNVMKNISIMLAVSIFLIFIGAFLEIYLSGSLIHSLLSGI
ncbi:MAG: stage II sporulation protein M [Candidatus Woesearchaeota archaeon]